MPGPHDDAPTPTGADTRRTVVFGPSEATWAVGVDAVMGIERIQTAAILPPSGDRSSVLSDLTQGTATINDAQIIVLDSERVLHSLQAGLA
jgi:chemotaxis signal transduction protein